MLGGEIVKVGKEWGLAEWYPGLRKNRKGKERGEEGDSATGSNDASNEGEN